MMPGDRWLRRAAAWLLVVLGGAGLTFAVVDSFTKGLALAVSTILVSTGVNAVSTDLRRHRE